MGQIPGAQNGDIVEHDIFLDTGKSYKNRAGTGAIKASSTGLQLVGVVTGGTSSSDMWANCPSEALATMTAARFVDDFLTNQISATGWVVTEDDAADTQTIDDARYGVLTLTCKATTDNDACQVQWKYENFRLTSGKKMWVEFYIRTTAGSAAQMDWFVGLCETEDLTGVADNHPANGFGFYKDDGAATYKLCNSDNGTDTNSASAVGTFVDSTWVRLGIYFDGGASGTGTLTPYVDGVAGTAIVATYGTQTELSPILMVRNGDATTTQNLKCDWVKIVQER